jgi:hypothetical protein
MAPQVLVATEHASQSGIRVTRTDGSHLVLLSPTIRADSLYGSQRVYKGDGTHVDLSVVIPLADIRQIAVERNDFAKTLGVAVLVSILFGLAMERLVDDALHGS